MTHAAIVHCRDKPLGADLTADEIKSTYEMVQIACFAGLAGREFFTPEAPCNSDAFTLYMQRMREDEPGFIVIRTRRREGDTWDGRALDSIVFSVPTHVSPVRRVTLVGRLLDGLVAFARAGRPE